MFVDRQDAGLKLSQALFRYKDQKQTVVLGLPRGGVVVAFVVSSVLHLPLDVICPRKIVAPHNEEFAIGAVTETGEVICNDAEVAQHGISKHYLDEMIKKKIAEAKKRREMFCGGKPLQSLQGKTVILVDDGLATGFTMRAAIAFCRKEKIKKLVVAVPVSPADTARQMQHLVDDWVCLETPCDFYAVGQFYEDFAQVEDEQVIQILSCSYKEPKSL